VTSLDKDKFSRIIDKLSPKEKALLAYYWPQWARAEQLAPKGADWSTWLVCAGRGWGKTRVGAEWVRSVAKPGARIAIVAPTAADARDVCIQGESGLLSCCPPWDIPEYQPSLRRVVWKNGAIATTYSADEPERLRGPQHTHAWCDEVGAWRYPETWDMLAMGLRLGDKPRTVVTTTPRQTPLMKIIRQSSGVIITRGRTLDNVDNLAPTFMQTMMDRYGGTRLARQELDGEDLWDEPGALWDREVLDETRQTRTQMQYARVVVSVDPAGSNTADSDETGIIVAAKGMDGHGYVLADLSGKYSPDQWARKAIAAYEQFDADRIIAEKNQGGDMVAHTLKTVNPEIPLRLVHASRGKIARAEPVAALYEQRKIHHVGCFGPLEDQMCTWVQGMKSPDRLDAMVWALTELFIGKGDFCFG
jgi:phage terminase large subunit-like protein